jgi:hypothetical protein
MALLSGRPNLDFGPWDQDKPAYFAAIQSGLDDPGPMTELVRRALSSKSLSKSLSGSGSVGTRFDFDFDFDRDPDPDFDAPGQSEPPFAT